MTAEPSRPEPTGRHREPAPVMLRPLSDTDLPAVIQLCSGALDLPEDAAEADQIVRRLVPAPDGRRTIALVATASATDPAPIGVAFGSLGRADPSAGYVDLIAVDPAHRRRGIGRALCTALERGLAGLGAAEALLAGDLPYIWPGIDVRYTAAVCAAEALGYRQDRTAWNMTVPLAGARPPQWCDTSADEARLSAVGVTVRRATGADLPALTALIRAHFGSGWVWEVAESIDREGTGCHVAVRAAPGADGSAGNTGPAAAGEGGEVLGFAAYGALRPSWFGPMGTAPAAQGLGVGGLLLRRCLADLRAAGLPSAQIGWVGPVRFYSGAVGARIERVFLLYRKLLPTRTG